MSYFSNKPAPSTGSELPMPRSTQEVTKDIKQGHKAKRRKRTEGDDSGLYISYLIGIAC